MEVDNGNVVIAVFFDIKIAFDNINHLIILKELLKLGFDAPSLKLIWSYLSGRRQRVVGKDGSYSSISSTSSGVPQGSSPGPILFLAIINRLRDHLKACKNFHGLFADDLEIHLSCKLCDLNVTIEILNNEIQNLILGLDLNDKKTEAIIFGSKYNMSLIKNRFVHPIRVNNALIEFKNVVKYLGINLTSTLSWDTQVNNISRKVHYTLHRLRASCLTILFYSILYEFVTL